jgi:hypothetical protein
MPQVGFKPTTQVFKWAKKVHALDRVVTVVGKKWTLQEITADT